MESREDMLNRLEMMAAGNDKWDLSDNDRAAIRMAVNECRSRQQAQPAPQQPSIGRIVIYHAEVRDYPAIIVGSGRTCGVDLAVFGYIGAADTVHNTGYGFNVGQWSWPERVA